MRCIQASYALFIMVFIMGIMSCTSGGSSDSVEVPGKNLNSKKQNPGQIVGQSSVINGGLTSQTAAAGTGTTLKQEQNFDLFRDDGSSFKLSALFNQANYLVLDLSAVSCSSCVKDAKDFSMDSSFTSLFNTKCQFATLVPNQELSDWKSTVGSTIFVAQRSYELRTSHSNLTNAFGVNLQGIPLFMIIDRTGAVVEAKKVLSINELPQKFFDLCGNGSVIKPTSTSTGTSTNTSTKTNTTTDTDTSTDLEEDPLMGEDDLSGLIGDCTGGG